jgi:nitrogen-specific signal transduction histidine kinase
MTSEQEPGMPAGTTPAFRERMMELADAVAEAGSPQHAETLRHSVEAWWAERRALEGELARLLEMHHEINNALVGVRGHAQLLLLGPAASEPRVRDRLEVIIRESGRIEKVAQQLREIRSRLGDPEASSRATRAAH